MAIFSASDVGADPFLAPGEFLDHPQARENGRRQVVHDPRVGETVQIGPLGLFSETPSVIGQPAPSSGEHQDEILASLPDLPTTLSVAAESRPSRTPTRRPLDGLLVVDCGYFYATPHAATLLAEAGARVIKLEPGAGDPGRRNWTASYSKAMVGKQSIVADLKSVEGRAIVHALARRADVFLHNFRPGTPERLGIDYETLRRINPQAPLCVWLLLREPRPLVAQAGLSFLAQRDRRMRDDRVGPGKPAAEPDVRRSCLRSRHCRRDHGRAARARADRARPIARDDDADFDGLCRLGVEPSVRRQTRARSRTRDNTDSLRSIGSTRRARAGSSSSVTGSGNGGRYAA